MDDHMSNNIDHDQHYPLARCHKCGLAMFLIRSENAPPDQEKLTYRCNRCGTNAERLYKIRSEATGLR